MAEGLKRRHENPVGTGHGGSHLAEEDPVLVLGAELVSGC
jgi:hypothetical protein